MLIGLIQSCSVSDPSSEQNIPIVAKPTATTIATEAVREPNEAIAEVQSIAATVSKREKADQSIAEAQNEKRAQTNLPFFCAPDEYKAFFEKFVWGKDEQGKDIRARYTADRIQVRNYHKPDQVLEVLRRRDDEFSIDLRDYRWVQLVPSPVDNSPYTRLKLDIDRISADTFRVDYIKAQYKYTGNETGTESEEVVQTFGNPAAYIFQHRNGCWRLTQKLRVN